MLLLRDVLSDAAKSMRRTFTLATAEVAAYASPSADLRGCLYDTAAVKTVNITIFLRRMLTV